MHKYVMLLLLLFLMGCGEVSSGTSTEAGLSDQQNQEKAQTEAGNKTFRSTSWGMSMSDVKKNEDFTLLEENDEGLLYSGNLGNLKMKILYSFINNELAFAGYSVAEEHSNPTEYIRDYERLKKSLVEKYGQPLEDQEQWFDDLYKDDPSQWGMAVLTGDLLYYAKWTTSNTDIYIGLSGDNFEKNFLIGYTSKRHKADIDKDSKEQSLNGL